MMRRLRRGDFHFNIAGRARRWFIVSGIVVLVSIASLFGRGVNAGLEFRGGSAFQVQAASTRISVGQVRTAVQKAGINDPTVQKVGSRGFQVETKHLAPTEQDKVATAIAGVTEVKRNDVE